MKNNSNSLLPDLTASTTLPFGAARQLKSGSVMDILGRGGGDLSNQTWFCFFNLLANTRVADPVGSGPFW